MNRHYGDILSRIAEPPSWWEEGGVPRYGTFDPAESTGIYCLEVALVEIACQDCEARFLVTFENASDDRVIARDIRAETLHYGDPPNVGCCAAGPTKSSEPVRVVQYWARGHSEYVEQGIVVDGAFFEWRRDPSLEVEFELR